MIYVFGIEKASLQEVLEIIGLWEKDDASLSQVVDVIIEWTGV